MLAYYFMQNWNKEIWDLPHVVQVENLKDSQETHFIWNENECENVRKQQNLKPPGF